MIMYYPYLEHSGVKGMHWGVRRYQNNDGSLTPAGRAHYGVGPARKIKSTVGSALKKVKKGASNVKKSTAKIVKTIKAKSAASRVKREERAERRLTKAVAKGNVNKILKGVDRMSDKELNEALNRARQVKALKDLKVPKKSITDTIGDVATTITKGATAVTAIAKARQERLKYREAREKWEDEQDRKYEEARKKWEEEHANDPKFKDSKAGKAISNFVKNAKEFANEGYVDNRTDAQKSAAKTAAAVKAFDSGRTGNGKHPTNTKTLGDIKDEFKSAIKSAVDSQNSTVKHPTNNKNFREVGNDIKTSSKDLLSSAISGIKKANGRLGNKSGIIDFPSKKNKPTADISVEDLTDIMSKKNRERLKRMGYL